MDTLVYFHLVATDESATNLSPETALHDDLDLQALDGKTRVSGASISLGLCVIALTGLGVSSPALALSQGDSNSDVASLQKKLQAAGYFNGPITGYYGPLTQASVSKFQQTHGISADGVAGSETLKILESGTQASVAPQPTSSPQKATDESRESPRTAEVLQKGDRNAQVTALQKKLQTAGYFNDPVTGYFGSLTQAAVEQFQSDRGLTANGIADDETLKSLELTVRTLTPSQPSAPEKQPSQPSAPEKQKEVADKPKEPPHAAEVLQRGDRNPRVTALQEKLQAAGYFNGPITGYYGSLTQEAVEKLQRDRGLIASGIVDKETLKALESPLPASTSWEITAPPSAIADGSKVGVSGKFNLPQSTPPSTPTPTTRKTTNSQKSVPKQPKPEKPIELEIPPKSPESPQTPITPTTKDSQKVAPKQPKPEKPVKPDAPKPTQSSQSSMRLEKTISGDISPKSVVHSGTGLFFAQNMMYSHTITVYDRAHNLIKTIPDTVNLSEYGYSKFKGNYQGAPVEASFSHDGKYAWVSNYKMYGPGFNNPGDDECNPSQKTDESFLYRINTDTLNVEKVIKVGSVPKFVATSPDDSLVLVSNWCSWDLSVVDTNQNKEIKRIELGRYPRGIAIDTPSDNAYVAVMGSQDIAKIDLNNFSVGWLRGIGEAPRHLSIDPKGRYLYTTLNGEGRIAKIDLKTGRVLNKVSTGNAPRSMVISDDGQRLYVVNYGSDTVSKVRTSDMKVLQDVKVGASPIGITYDSKTREVWVACYSGQIMVFQD